MKKTTLISLLLLSTVVSFSQLNGDYLNVEGQAKVFATPELMLVNIPFEVESKSYSECSQVLINKYNDMLASLVKNGFEQDKIKSNGLSISEKFSWVNNKREKDGYQGRIQMEVESLYSQKTLNSLMNALQSDKYDYGYNLSFKLSESQKEALLAEAIEKAVNDASAKAEMLAKSLKIKLVKIKQVNFDMNTFSPEPLLRESRSLMLVDDEVAGTPELSLEAKPQQITKSVRVTWKIKQ